MFDFKCNFDWQDCACHWLCRFIGSISPDGFFKKSVIFPTNAVQKFGKNPIFAFGIKGKDNGAARIEILSHRHTDLLRFEGRKLLVHRQDGACLSHDAFRRQVYVPQPSPTFRQVPVGEHASCLFRRTERFVPRIGDRRVGKGMDALSGAALRHEHGQKHEP